MQILAEMLGGLIAMLAAAMLSQFGVELQSAKSSDREVERVQVCQSEPSETVTVKAKAPC